MAKKSKDLTPPEETAGDTAHTVAKGVLGSIPVVGGIGSEIFSAVIQPPLQARQQKWRTAVGEGLDELRRKIQDFDLSELPNNPEFISAVTMATRAALATHHEEKLEALKAAVMNVAVANAPEEDEQLTFITFVEQLTPWHLRLLRYFKDPRAYGEERGVDYPNWSSTSPAQVLEHTFPELKGQRERYDVWVGDLNNRGLSEGGLHVLMTAHGAFGKRTTPLGDRFLNFITSPAESSE